MLDSVVDPVERAVWERVRMAQYRQEPSVPEEPDCGCPEPDCPPCIEPDADQLLAWICHECEDAALYRHLARCLPRCVRRQLEEMAADEQCHARSLAAQYYLLTGCRPQIHACFRPDACPMELLRRRYQEELDGSAGYHDAAMCAHGPLRELLDVMSRDEARHSRMALCIVESVL